MDAFERPRPEMGTESEVLHERLLAFVADTLGVVIVVGVVANLLYLLSEPVGIAVNLLGVPLYFAYFALFEAASGQTPGKMVTGVVVVGEDGSPPDLRATATRALLLVVDWFPYPLFLVGLAAIYRSDGDQRIGDILAETVVVRAREKGEKL
jgi:uncharacterized RDD family membrane protein YckC